MTSATMGSSFPHPAPPRAGAPVAAGAAAATSTPSSSTLAVVSEGDGNGVVTGLVARLVAIQEEAQARPTSSPRDAGRAYAATPQ